MEERYRQPLPGEEARVDTLFTQVQQRVNRLPSAMWEPTQRHNAVTFVATPYPGVQIEMGGIEVDPITGREIDDTPFDRPYILVTAPFLDRTTGEVRNMTVGLIGTPHKPRFDNSRGVVLFPNPTTLIIPVAKAPNTVVFMKSLTGSSPGIVYERERATIGGDPVDVLGQANAILANIVG